MDTWHKARMKKDAFVKLARIREWKQQRQILRDSWSEGARKSGRQKRQGGMAPNLRRMRVGRRLVGLRYEREGETKAGMDGGREEREVLKKGRETKRA